MASVDARSLTEDGTPALDAGWYLLRNPDVAAAVVRGEMTALSHYLRHGWREGRDPGPLFDTGWYLSRYGDVAAAVVNPLTHYLEFGQVEGRVPTPFFDASYYLGRYGDVAEAVTRGETNAYAHFLTHGYGEGRSALGLLDESYYLAHNPDVAASSFSPFQHYAEFGQFENRAPSESFQPEAYAAELAALGIVPVGPSLAHYYLTAGQSLPAPDTPALPLAPVISDMLSNVTFLENTVNAAAQKLDSSVTLTDSDTYHFSGGMLSVTGSGLVEDALSFDTSGTVGIAGGNVTVGGLVVGTLTGSGANGASLTLQLNGNATTPRIETLLENLTYANNSDTPTVSRTATITLDDGAGGRTTHSIAITVTGEVDDQLLTGTAASDTLTGGTGNDTLVGLAGADTLTGAGGNDLLYGGMDDSAIAAYDLTALSTAANLKLWLDGNDLDGDGNAEGLSEAGLTGSAVGTWADKSGQVNHATQSTAGSKPTYSTNSVNGKSALSFDGGDRLINASFSVSQPLTIIVVSQVSVSDTDGATFIDSYDPVQSIIYRGKAGDQPNNFVAIAGGVSVITTSSNNLWNAHTFISQGASSIYYVNSNSVGTANTGSNSLSGLSLGDIRGNPNPFIAGYSLTGYISEAIVFNTALTDPDRQAIEYYLAEKWNLNVAGDNDILSGGAGSDTLYGGTGNDTLDGGADADTLLGGAGADSLVGGLAADLFRFTATTDAGTGAAKDTIADFSQAQGDKIDLAAMNLGTIYLLGTTAFTNTGAAEIRWSVSGSDTTIQLDTDGNGSANMEILLQNFNATTAPMTVADFLGTVVNHATFTDITTAAGVGDTGAGAGTAFADFDVDGFLDIYVVNQGANILYRNNGNNTFTNITATAGVGDASTGSGTSWSDYDNDGDLDLQIANSGGANVLYRNNNGSFVNIAVTANVANIGDGGSVNYIDYDGDGDLDLYVANASLQADILYRNNGDGTFINVSGIAGIADAANGRSTSSGDFDGDGDLDIYIANHGQANLLYRNNGNGTFSNIATAAGVADTSGSRGVSWADYDNDEDLDLYVANNSGQTDILYRNNGNGTFTNVSSSAGINDTASGNGIMWSDYDTDGDLDIYVTAAFGGSNIFYRNNGNGSFTNIATASGAGYTGNSYGITWGDIDSDGDLDLYVANYGQANVLYRNNANPTATSWLAVDIQGSAAGVTLHLYDGATRIATRTVDGGSGYGSQNATPVHFYALDSGTSYSLRFTMPDGTAYDLALGSPDGAVHKVILGSSGADTRTGLTAADYLFGLGGNDTLNGGAGADTLTGGSGADLFTFTSTAHSTTTNPDRITDFVNGTDTITLTGLGFTSLADFETLSHSGGVTTLADTGTSFAVTFTGDVTALLDNTDFIW